MSPRVDLPTIRSVDVSVYTIPTSGPEADGTLAWESTTVVVTQITADWQTGTGWTYGAAQCADVIRSTLAPLLLGTPALDISSRWESMVRAVRNEGRQGIAGYAISAVDTALWDLKARLLGVPLHHLFGTARDQVPVYGSGGFTTYSAQRLSDQIEHWLDLGIDSVKIKIAESWGTDLPRDEERIRSARELIGPNRHLFVDANGGYTAKQAVRLLSEVEDARVSWLEEPVSSDDLDGLALVRSAVTADVTAGEYGFDLVYFARMIQAGSVDCLQIDATRCGGYTEWIRAAAVAHAAGLEVSAHCGPALHAAVAAATPNLRHVEYFHDHTCIEFMLFDNVPVVRDGAMVLDESAPGNGLSVRTADAEHWRVG